MHRRACVTSARGVTGPMLGAGRRRSSGVPPLAPAAGLAHFGCASPEHLVPEVLSGPAAAVGARQAHLLPPFRADLRAQPRGRDAGDPLVRGTEVRVPKLLLPADDPGGVLRRPAVRGAGGGVWGGAPVLFSGSGGAGECSRAAGAVGV